MKCCSMEYSSDKNGEPAMTFVSSKFSVKACRRRRLPKCVYSRQEFLFSIHFNLMDLGTKDDGNY